MAVGDTFIEKLWESVQGFFVAMFQATWSGMLDIFSPGSRIVFQEFEKFFSIDEPRQWDNMLSMFEDSGLLAPETKAELLKLKDLAPPMDWAAYLMLFYKFTTQYVEATLYAATADLRHALNSKYSPELTPPESAIAAAFIAPEKTQEIRNELKLHGYSDKSIDLLFLSHYRLYDEKVVRDLYLRGVLTEDQMFMRLRELGYTDTRIKEMVQSWALIPGPSDLFHLVAKEAFEPEMIQKMGLLDEFPVEQVAWLKKQGLSEFWAQKYWAAHWEQPSIMQGYEMLHRDVIGFDELDMLFKTVEIPPYWREKLTKIAYMPYTRVDTRRMHDLGVLSDAELIKAYKDQGYDEEHALNMAKFTVLYNQQANKDLTKGEIITGYKEKVVSAEDASSLLQQAGYSSDEADYLLALQDFKEARDIQGDLIKNIGSRYKNRLLNSGEARDRLNQLNLTQERIDVLIDKWDVNLYTDMKLPSKDDLNKLFLNKIVDEDTYRYQMNLLGYNFKYVGWYLDLAKAKKG